MIQLSQGTLLLLLVALCAATFIWGSWSSRKKDRARRFESARQLYRDAIRLRDAGRTGQSLAVVARSVGEYPTHEAHNLVGHLLDELGEPAGASDAWFHARWCNGVPADWNVYYFYREARALASNALRRTRFSPEKI